MGLREHLSPQVGLIFVVPFKTEMITLEIVTECKLRLLERPTVFHFFQLRFVYGIVFI